MLRGRVFDGRRRPAMARHCGGYGPRLVFPFRLVGFPGSVGGWIDRRENRVRGDCLAVS